MKILTFSDIHSNEIFLEKLDRIIKDEKPDYIVMAGDLLLLIILMRNMMAQEFIILS